MSNVFSKGFNTLPNVALDMVPVTPSDTVDLDVAAASLYIETGGDVSFISGKGNTRTVTVPDNFVLQVVATRVLATDTTATGIFAYVVN